MPVPRCDHLPKIKKLEIDNSKLLDQVEEQKIFQQMMD